MRLSTVASGVLALAGFVLAQDEAAEVAPIPFPTTCPDVPANRFPYKVHADWQVTKVAGGLEQPRALVFDSAGNLLVLGARQGINILTFGADGCVASSKSLNQNIRFNHGLSLTPDGKKLYASSETNVWSWDYDAATQALTNQKTIVKNMSSGIHSSRTVHVVPNKPNLILVSVGSNSNFDMNAGDMRATVRVFDADTAPADGWEYNTQGHQLGWGLRNEVALAFDPNGHVWGAENSGDEFQRTVNGQATDIHIDNPAEELNYLGDPSVPNEQWYGYPTCFTVWDPSVIRDAAFKTGDQFVVSPNAHAPIDSTFDKTGENLYITFHGSWNRQPATGYSVIEVPFTQLEDGTWDPAAPADSMSGYTEIFGAENPGACQSMSLTMSTCFRLSAITFDPSGTNLYISSDNQSEGEIWVLKKKA
ncbi:unnamed protein product [Parascedosporium putredinis]|uniref:Pyrroloquinoline quinone-dependent pyranose dehydrogenase beta-propeller domain-containing protein n=1 Tax=Parascedosporium putredinis TaxID=1442378 RepID=A0A9P1H3P3_9PEZI|nr:unnamed protein product [Parascedosporium putredinis]CAI7994902.1 unnamed protein product [Parascedosporium putredinis]